MQLQSASGSALVRVESPLTPDVEIHEMAMQGDVMRMRQVAAIRLPAGGTVEIKPGSYHNMLLNLRQQVSAGDSVPLRLLFEGRQSVPSIRRQYQPPPADCRDERPRPSSGTGGARTGDPGSGESRSRRRNSGAVSAAALVRHAIEAEALQRGGDVLVGTQRALAKVKPERDIL